MKGILLLSAGSKVAITRIAKQSALKRGLVLHATDNQANVPVRLVADAFAVLPDHDRDQWIDALLAYCSENGIGLIIPTRHSDLAHLSAARERFEKTGIQLALSGPQTLALCLDKTRTHRFLQAIGAPTPRTVAKGGLTSSPLADRFPLFAKPASGAASQDTRIIKTPSEIASIPDDWILQSVAEGDEYTVNLYLDRQGIPLGAIPHQRVAVESGEVVQARTRRLPRLIDESLRIAAALPDAQGLLNLQCFYREDTDELQIIEINPRMGGGFPICHEAKGHYIEWLCQEHLESNAPRPPKQWTDNLLMMRYREAVFELPGPTA